MARRRLHRGGAHRPLPVPALSADRGRRHPAHLHPVQAGRGRAEDQDGGHRYEPHHRHHDQPRSQEVTAAVDYSTNYQPGEDPNLVKDLQAAEVDYSFTGASSPIGSILISLLPFILIGAIWYFVYRQDGGSSRGSGRRDLRRGPEQGQEGHRRAGGRHLQGCRRRRRGHRRTPGDHPVPQDPGAVRPPGRPHPEGRAAHRPARDRQDPAGQGDGGRGRSAVLREQRLRVRGDVRGGRGGPRARPVRAGARGGAGHRVHRRGRRHRAVARGGLHHGRRQRRARADAQPVAGRDRRLRHRRAPPGDHHGRHQPAGSARQGAAARRPVRPPGGGGQPGPHRPGADPQDPQPGHQAGPRLRPGAGRPHHARASAAPTWPTP